MNFEFSITQPDAQATGTIVKIAGELDSSAAPTFSEGVEPLMALSDKNIIIDMTDLEYISSAGLRILMTLAKQAAAHNGSVKIVGIKVEILDILQLTGLDKVFLIEK